MSEQVIHIATNVLKAHYRNQEFFDDIEGPDFAKFKQSIADDGVITPVIVSRNMTIVSGHQRHRACVELGIESIPCIIREELVEEDDIVRQLIAANFGRIKNNEAKFREALKTYVDLNGNKRGGNRKSKGQNALLKSLDEIAKEAGMSTDELKRMLRIGRKLSPEITKLFDDGEITQATALLVCKLSKEEQSELFKHLTLDAKDNSVNEQFKKLLVKTKKMQNDFAAKEREYQRQVADQANEIGELKAQEPKEVEVAPVDYEEIKQTNESLLKEVADLKAKLEIAKKPEIAYPINNVPTEDSLRSFPILCSDDDVPDINEIDSEDERERLLDANPDLLLSEISDITKNKRISYRVLERALGLTNEKNSLLVSREDYAGFIREYNGSNCQRLATRIQKYKTQKT